VLLEQGSCTAVVYDLVDRLKLSVSAEDFYGSQNVTKQLIKPP